MDKRWPRIDPVATKVDFSIDQIRAVFVALSVDTLDPVCTSDSADQSAVEPERRLVATQV